ncbi:protein FAM114A2 [Anabrus simplex]|uniref:protein FAM114A2 n=1 Tax=Anabrus simplex TaxID=316456 RepID=UPI0035A2C224
MATSDSEDFESADEDLGGGDVKIRGTNSLQSVKGKSHPHSGTVKKTVENSSETLSGSADSSETKSSSEVEGLKNEDENSIHVTLHEKLRIIEESNEVKSENESIVRSSLDKNEKSKANEEKSSGGVEGWEDDLDELDDDDVVVDDDNDDNEEVPKQVEEVIQKKEKLENPDGQKFGLVLDRLTSPQKEEESSGGGWGNWGGWGVSSLLSTATESVSTLTGHVSQGLNTVLEVGLGAPSPEELARLDHEREQSIAQEQSSKESEAESEGSEEVKTEDSGGLFGLGRVISGVSSITKLVETAGTKVVSGGLDTLETIGKKTMDILQEGDPGLKKKRAYFSNKILLSQVLREAKEKAEHEHKEHVDREAARKAHFETLFDDYQGLVHLEALEMLSKQCDLKLQSHLLTSTGSALVELQQTLNDLKEQCQLPEEEDVEEAPADVQREKLADVGKGLGVHVATDKLMKTWDETEQWLKTCRTNFESLPEDTEILTVRQVHQNAMATMARLTAESVEQFHKVAELLLVLEERNPSSEAKILLDMTTVLCSLISTAATRFSECLNASPENSVDPETVTSLITNIFLEAAHSSSYIQEAFQLLVPVLQVGLIAS